MFPTDHLYGSFDGFETHIHKDDEGYYVAEACGITAKAVDQMQAVNDLNAKLLEKMQKGELRPDMG